MLVILFFQLFALRDKTRISCKITPAINFNQNGQSIQVTSFANPKNAKSSAQKPSYAKKESRTRKIKTGAERNQKEGEIGDQKGQDTVL